MPEITVNIRVDLGAFLNEVQRALQAVSNLAALGFNSSERLTPADLQLPTTAMAVGFASNEPWDIDRARTTFSRWVLLNGFRDAAEITTAMLDQVHSVVCAWNLHLRGTTGHELTGADYNTIVVDATRSFHRLGLPKKIGRLVDRGLAFDQRRVQQVLSINAARNCLVHRQGVVTDLDTAGGNSLEVHWERLTPFVVDDQGEREILPPAYVKGGSKLSVRTTYVDRSFAIGTALNLSAQDFADICWSLYTFASATSDSLKQYGQDRGLQFQKPGGGA